MFPYCTYVMIVILFKNVIQDNDSCYKKNAQLATNVNPLPSTNKK